MILTRIKTHLNYILFKDGYKWTLTILYLDGKIDGFSENLKYELNIVDNDMSELHEKLHIFHLIPNLF